LKRRQVLAFFEKLPPCLVGIEACASSQPQSGRETSALPCPQMGCRLNRSMQQALNLSAGVSNCKVSRGRSFS
jgi:hypothetical protein